MGRGASLVASVDARVADRAECKEACRVAKARTCPAMSLTYCQTSCVLRRAPPLGAMPPKLWLCSVLALMFKTINVDFLTLDLDITAVLFLGNYLTENN